MLAALPRTHYLRNLLTEAPKSAQPWVAALVRTISDQPAESEVRARYARVVEALEARDPAAAERLDAARETLLAFAAFPRRLWRQIGSNNPQERLNEIRRRADVVGILPGLNAIVRLVGALLMEQTTHGPRPAATWASSSWPRLACA